MSVSLQPGDIIREDVPWLAPERLERLGAGGQGTVYAVDGSNDFVFKRFSGASAASADRDELEALVQLPQGLPPEDARELLACTTWPTAMVIGSSGRAVGLLMPMIERPFFHQFGLRNAPKTCLREWLYLMMRRTYMGNTNLHVGDVAQLASGDVLSLIARLSETLALMHRLGLVVGDISSKNLLWAMEPEPRIKIIDCDSVRLAGRPGVFGDQKESPDWDDVHLGGRALSQESDIYKLGLATFRALWAAATDRPDARAITTELPDGQQAPDQVRTLVMRSVGGQGRPAAAEWAATLSRLARYDGRPVVALNENVDVRPPPSGQLDRGPRPTLKLRS